MVDFVVNVFHLYISLFQQELVEEAKTYHLLTDRRGELRSPRTRPRKASGIGLT